MFSNNKGRAVGAERRDCVPVPTQQPASCLIEVWGFKGKFVLQRYRISVQNNTIAAQDAEGGFCCCVLFFAAAWNFFRLDHASFSFVGAAGVNRSRWVFCVCVYLDWEVGDLPQHALSQSFSGDI